VGEGTDTEAFFLLRVHCQCPLVAVSL
jgi:hypothetical protein